MSEQTERPLGELVRELAIWRNDRVVIQTMYDDAFARFQEQRAPDLEYLAHAKVAMAALESEIRTRGAAIAAETRQAPCAGTKVRNERVIRYYAINPSTGELMRMDQAAVTATVRDHIVDHGWLSMLKPDVTAWEKAIKALPDEDRPPFVGEEWQTDISINADLSALLETEPEVAP